MKPVDSSFRIRGEKIYLRPITAEDTERVLAWRNAPDVVRNFIYREKISREEHMDWLENKVFRGAVHQFVMTRRLARCISRILTRYTGGRSGVCF